MSDRSLKELALAYVESFCAADIDGLARLLAPDLEFYGPYLRCHTAADYLSRLRSDPPEPAEFQIIATQVLAADAVGVEWQYRKPGGSLLLRQRFIVRNERIAEIHLELDTDASSEQSGQGKGAG